jgi:hypothetical protein
MADDGQPGKPAEPYKAVQPGQVPSPHQIPTERGTADERRHFITRHWRPIMFLAILLAAATAGLYFKSDSNPGTEPPQFRAQAPQYINVYETDPKTPIALTVTLYQGPASMPLKLIPYYENQTELRAQGFTSFNEEVDVKVTPAGSATPGTVMIASSSEPIPGFGPVFQVKNYVSRGLESTAPAPRFASPIHLLRASGNTWVGDAYFSSVPVIFQDGGAVFGHLPSVSAFSSGVESTNSVLQADYRSSSRQLQNVLFINLLSNIANYPNVPGVPAGDYSVPLNRPYSISCTELLSDIAPALRNEEIIYANPNPNSSNDLDYVWQSSSGLEPTFKATDTAAVDSQNQAAFISGIAFGVAGAAAIAVVQELPKELPSATWWPRLKRRRKSSPQNGAHSP